MMVGVAEKRCCKVIFDKQTRNNMGIKMKKFILTILTTTAISGTLIASDAAKLIKQAQQQAVAKSEPKASPATAPTAPPAPAVEKMSVMEDSGSNKRSFKLEYTPGTTTVLDLKKQIEKLTGVPPARQIFKLHNTGQVYGDEEVNFYKRPNGYTVTVNFSEPPAK
jgi:hypothetical protein